MDAWDILGIPQTNDRKAVKKAYSRLLKTTRPDDDPDAYQRLREAFDWASGYCRHMAKQTSKQDDTQTIDDQKTTASHALEEQIPTEDLKPNIVKEKPESALSDKAQEHLHTDPNSSINADQKAYEDALSAAKTIFDITDEEHAIDAFNTLVHGHDLLHLKTRAYFENICLHALIELSNDDLPYGLLNTIAKTFQWFEQQHPNPEKAQRISYLNTRLNAFSAYQNILVNSAYSGASWSEKSAAKLLIGKYRPKYFHVLRFLGNNNKNLRKITAYFEVPVKQDLCPELKTDTFFWWDTQLSRCLFSFWHIIVGLFIGIIGFQIFNDNIYVIPLKYIGLAISGSIIISSLSVWALQFSVRKLKPPLQNWWEGIKEKRSTDFILSSIFVFSILFWRSNPDIENIGYLWLPAIAATLLLFGLRGSGMMLMQTTIYSISLALIDPLEKHPNLVSLCWIYGFVNHKLFTQLFYRLPNNMQRILVSKYGYHWLFAAFIGSLMSTALLFILAR